MSKLFPNFTQVVKHAQNQLFHFGRVADGCYWQGVDVSRAPEMKTRELLNYDFQVPVQTEDLGSLAQDIKPNLPWADRHFIEERVSGDPVNPGETWKIWSHGHSASKFLDQRGQFNHSYAERYWPRHAGKFAGGEEPMVVINDVWQDGYKDSKPREGIRYRYGDLNDLISTLARDPETRQAYLPVWFPEDGSHNDRKPCTLGYLFMMRGGYFHCNYYIRSCDIIRHFQDDIYLTVRLQLWILDQLRKQDEKWKRVQPGMLAMYIGSLHCFQNDIRQLKYD